MIDTAIVYSEQVQVGDTVVIKTTTHIGDVLVGYNFTGCVVKNVYEDDIVMISEGGEYIQGKSSKFKRFCGHWVWDVDVLGDDYRQEKGK